MALKGRSGLRQGLHFAESEFLERQSAVRRELEQSGLDGLVISSIDDAFWLTGFDSTGFNTFHCIFIGVDGELVHLARTPDIASVAYTSVCEDVRIVGDGHGESRSSAIKRLLSDLGMSGRRVGVQLASFGMLPELYVELRAALDGWCELVDASSVVSGLRLVKSPTELAHLRRAGEILQEASNLAIDMTRPGAFEGDIAGEIYRTICARDGDVPANLIPFGSGEKALLVRYASGRGMIQANDQITFEPGAGYRHYNAVNMFTVLTGPRIDDRHVRMHAACVQAMAEVQSLMRPGTLVGSLYNAHRAVFEERGFSRMTFQSCGYPLGVSWPPTWVQKPIIAEGEPLALERGMTFFVHMILTDHEAGLTMSLGETCVITDSEPEVLAPVQRDLIVAE